MKTRAKFFFIFFIFLKPFAGISQELPEVIPPSPTVANLMQFEEVPISYYTGQPNISIPIYSKSISGGMAMSIGLSYNTQGVKLNSRSGWTGTGWSLNAGGTISRTVRGEPDEITTNTSANKTGIYHLDDYWNYNDLSTDKAEFNYHVIGSSASKYDNKPDLYQFNFMGITGRFVILKEGNALVPKFITNNSNIKVELFHNNDYTINSFRVTDTKGYTYLFEEVESSLTSPFTGSLAQGDISHNVSMSQAQQAYSANTAWHLTKIKTSTGIDIVSLTYSISNEIYAASVSSTKNRIVGTDGSGLQNLISNQYNKGILEPKHSITYQNISTPTKKLSKIIFLQDGTEVDFNMDNQYNHPETNGSVLKSIIIKNNIEIDKTYNFSYEETTDSSSGVIKKRVWLTKITETADNLSQDYNLNYFNKENLPGFNDGYDNSAWGYYSGLNNGAISCSNSIYSDNIIKTGLLTSIEYPTGGVKEFDFEHNTYSYFQDALIDTDEYYKNPRNTEVVSQFTDDLVYVNRSSPLELTIDTFTLDFPQNVFISSWVSASPSQYLNEHRIIITNTTSQETNGFFELNEQCSSVFLAAGNYEMVLVPKQNILLDQYQITGDYRVSFTDLKPTIKQEMLGGGVRIKEIRFKDDANTSNNSKKIQFTYNQEGNEVLSSGVIDSKAEKLERTYIKNTLRFLFGNPLNSCGAFSRRNIQYEVTESGYNVELSQGSYVGYRHVKVKEDGNGYKTYVYTSPYDYPSPQGTFAFEIPRPKENLDYKRGLLLKEHTFNQSGDILKEVNYLDNNGEPNYEFSETLLFIDRNVTKPNCEYLQFYDLYDFYTSGTVQLHVPSSTGNGNCSDPAYAQSPCGEFSAIPADFNSGWAKLKGTTTKEHYYDASNNQSVKETRQEFTYNPDNYQIAVQDTYYDVKGVDEHLQTRYYYPLGSNLGSNPSAVIDKLIASNKVTEVLETQSFRNPIPLNLTSGKISETHNIYHDFDASLNDLMLPKAVKVGKGSIAPEPRIEFLKYDDYGNPIELRKADGTSIVYLYGFKGSVPVAKITNASYSTVSSVLGGTTSFAGNINAAQEISLRNATSLANAMISFYRYDPLVGVISTSDDKGYETTYEYDAFNRLIRVKDAQGHILGENSYRYKNQ